MKNFRKLILAGVMLVFALVAVVSSTYAWFTMQQEAEVTSIDLNVATAGKDLQVSFTNESAGYGYTIKFPTIDASNKLTPVTFENNETTPSFKELVFQGENQFLTYTTATLIDPSASEAPTNKLGYVAFDLFFKSSSKSDKVYLDLSKNVLTSTNAELKKSIRIMFVEYTTVEGATVLDWSTKKIYEPGYDANSTFGTGLYFDTNESYIAFNAFNNGTPTNTDDDFIKISTDGSKYELNSTVFTADKLYTTNTNVYDTNKFLVFEDLGANTVKQIRAFIWIEGWDGDATNLAGGSQISTYFNFKAEDVAGN